MYSIEELKNYENHILNMDCIDFLKNCPDNYFNLCIYNDITCENKDCYEGTLK